MNKEIVNNITETIIDELYEQTIHYMYKSNQYTESNDEFVKDQEKFVIEVINNSEDMIEWIIEDEASGNIGREQADTYIDNLEQMIKELE